MKKNSSFTTKGRVILLITALLAVIYSAQAITQPTISYSNNFTNASGHRPYSGSDINITIMLTYAGNSFSPISLVALYLYNNQTGSFAQSTICDGGTCAAYSESTLYNISKTLTVTAANGAVVAYYYSAVLYKGGIGNFSNKNSSTYTFNVGNTPPVASNVQTSPAVVTSPTTLTCAYSYFDWNGDADNATTFRWFNNTGLVTPRSNKATLLSGNVTISTWYICEVTPSDGDNGTTVNSTPVGGFFSFFDEETNTPLLNYIVNVEVSTAAVRAAVKVAGASHLSQSSKLQ